MAASPRRLALRTGLAGLAVTVSAALAGAGVAAAEPTAVPTPDAPSTTAPSTENPNSPALATSPLDTQLADALRTVKQSGAADKLVEALKDLLAAQGQVDPGKLVPGADPSAPKATPAPANPTAPDVPASPAASTVVPGTIAPAAADPAAALDLIQNATGAQVLTPALAPFCTAPTADNPLGLTSAPAVAFSGPFPEVAGQSVPDLVKSWNIGFLNDLLANNDDTKQFTQMLTKDQTAFAIVPPADTTSSQFQVAWFNTATMQGNLVPLKPLDDLPDAGALKALLGTVKTPLRLARVDTGQGSILTAVFGTTTTAGHTCYFLPALGVVKNPN
ncbi:MAG: hypothetical protein QM658_13565 [Gordonia sp. (in: high G+C Gram-positive bacteria)]